MTLSPELTSQLERARNHVGVCDSSSRTQIEVKGQDAAKFLHNFCTQDVNCLQPGEGGETFFCDVRGKTIGHGFLYRHADSIVIETAPDQATTLCEHLDRYLITEDVELNDRGGEWGLVAVVGQAAGEFLQQTLAVSPPENDVATISISPELELRSTLAYGRAGYHLRCPASEVDALLKQCTENGAARIDAAIADLIRIAQGAPQFGTDITPNNLPQEIGRDNAISFTKGCYLGQETVARIDALGHVNWQLVGIQGPAQLTSGAELRAGEKAAGEVRSCATHPASDATFGLALVRRERAKVGETLETAAGSVAVVALPHSLDAEN